MIGLTIIFVLIVWFLIVEFIARVIARKLSNNVVLKLVIVMVMIVVIYPFPLIDEILAKPQYESLCKKYSKVFVRNNSKGKVVFLDDVDDVELKGYWVDFTRSKWVYRDTLTKEIVVSYDMLRASGGLLVKFLGFPEQGNPILFTYSCEEKYKVRKNKIFHDLDIIQINRDQVS